MYKEQRETVFGEYTVIPWVISSARSFSAEAISLAEKANVRLINGNEFSRMLIDNGMTELNNAFES